jgi:hypothetical protein
MDPRREHVRLVTRRWFLNAGGSGLGLAALWTLLGEDVVRAAAQVGAAGKTGAEAIGGLPGLPHFAPKAKRVIYLFMAGAPSHIDLFDYKPKLMDMAAKIYPIRCAGPAAHRLYKVPVELSCHSVSVQVRAAWAVGRVVE